MKRMMDTAYRTYKTRENAIAAIEKKLGHIDEQLRYVIVATEDGRYVACLIGAEAINYSVAAEIPCLA